MNIDIIIPTFNSYKTLKKTLDSIEKAKYFSKSIDIKILIADGGSKDKTLNLIESYSSKLNIIIASKKDNSPEEGIAKAFKEAKSEYTTIIGADDFISKDYFEQIKISGIGDKDIYFPPRVAIYKIDLFNKIKIIKLRKLRSKRMLRYTNPGMGFGWIMKTKSLKSFVKKRGHMLYTNNYKYATDNELISDLIASGWNYLHNSMGESKYFYYIGGRSFRNGIEGSYEACEIAKKSAKGIKLDIDTYYFLWRNWFRLKSLFFK